MMINLFIAILSRFRIRLPSRNRLSILSLLILSFIQQPARSEIRFVPRDYDTIQAAIDSCNSSDTVIVGRGIWFEHIEINSIGLTLGGNYIFTNDPLDIEETVLDGGLTDRCISVLNTFPDTVKIIGFTIQNGRGEGQRQPGGLLVSRSSTIITNNRFFQNQATQFGAVLLLESISTVLENEFVENHAASFAGALGGIRGVVYLERNKFISNSDNWSSGGIGIEFSSKVVVKENLFQENSGWLAAGGARVTNVEKAIIAQNRFIGNEAGMGGGIFLQADTLTVVSNLFQENFVTRDDGRRGSGGGLLINPECEVSRISHNYFYKNASQRDGAGVSIGTDTEFSHNILRNNIGAKVAALYGITVNNITNTVECEFNLFEGNQLPPDSNITLYFGGVSAELVSTLSMSNNDFIGNERSAAGVLGQGTLELQNNYWGHETGPYHEEQNPMGLGDTVTADVPVFPYSSDPFTDFRPPQLFSLLSPIQGDTNSTIPCLFSWEAAQDPNFEDTVRYLIEFSQDSTFAEYFVEYVGQSTEYQLYRMNFEQLYYWRVKAIDRQWQQTYSNTSESFYFSNALLPPEPFQLVLPEDGSDFSDSSTRFVWENSVDPSLRDSVTYELQLSNAEEFFNPTVFNTGLETSTILDSLPVNIGIIYWRVKAEDSFGNEVYCERPFSIAENPVHERFNIDHPTDWRIQSIYPNPFNDFTQIKIQVPQKDYIQIRIYDVAGGLVDILFSGEVISGYNTFYWKADVASGIYFVILKSSSSSLTKKIALIR
ncbi:T9SS type A sorting domain-containing protein [bacterium]|nr:T9SS type A sorting domain-containing protein [bacterium]